MEQEKLVIASVLKPVDDTRMYEKFALSISQANKYEVNIIGFESKNIPKVENIVFHPIFNFKRLEFSRIIAPLQFLKLIKELKPKVLIINTHELLFAASLYKAFFKTKLIYDLRENYFLNIKHLHSFPFLIRSVLAYYVRTKETILSKSIDHFLLAEKCYKDQLPFISKNHIVLENKATKYRSLRSGNKDIIQLLFTGTINDSTGIFQIIELAKKLHNLESKIRLKIVGFCAQPTILEKLKSVIKNESFIELIGGDQLVPHRLITEYITSSDFGFIYYPANAAIKDKIPTKLYEFLAAMLPIICDHQEPVHTITKNYTAAVHIDFTTPNVEQTLSEMSSAKFYTNQPKEEVLWSSEVKKLLDIL